MKSFSLRQAEREPTRSKKAQESNRLRPELILQAQIGVQLSLGSKSLKHRFEAGKFRREVQERKGTGDKKVSDPREEKSSAGRTPRAWGAEKGFRGSVSSYHREGSQTLRVGLLESKPSFQDAFERE
jgi:hypothetical protein